MYTSELRGHILTVIDKNVDKIEECIRLCGVSNVGTTEYESKRVVVGRFPSGHINRTVNEALVALLKSEGFAKQYECSVEMRYKTEYGIITDAQRLSNCAFVHAYIAFITKGTKIALILDATVGRYRNDMSFFLGTPEELYESLRGLLTDLHYFYGYNSEAFVRCSPSNTTVDITSVDHTLLVRYIRDDYVNESIQSAVGDESTDRLFHAWYGLDVLGLEVESVDRLKTYILNLINMRFRISITPDSSGGDSNIYTATRKIDVESLVELFKGGNAILSARYGYYIQGIHYRTIYNNDCATSKNVLIFHYYVVFHTKNGAKLILDTNLSDYRSDAEIFLGTPEELYESLRKIFRVSPDVHLLRSSLQGQGICTWLAERPIYGNCTSEHLKASVECKFADLLLCKWYDKAQIATPTGARRYYSFADYPSAQVEGATAEALQNEVQQLSLT